MRNEPLIEAEPPQSAFAAQVAVDQAVLESIPAAVYVCAVDGTIVRFNRRAARFWGRSPKIGDKDEKFCGSFRLYDMRGRRLPHARTPMAAALRTGRAYRDREVTMERPDGSRIVVSVNIEPLKDHEGRIEGAINCFQDITARKRVEQELQASRIDLEDHFEQAPVGMHWVDSRGIILRANRAELELLGYRSEEYIGRHIAEFHVDQPKILNMLEALAGGQRLERESARMRAKDGSIKHVLISSSGRFCEGELVNTRCVTLDVTGDRQAEAIEQQFVSIVENSQDAIVSKDLEGTITSWNRGAERLFGYTEKEALGESITLVIPPERRYEEVFVLNSIRKGESIIPYDTVRRRKDGSLVDVSLTVAPVKDAHGRVVGASKIARDITARKRAELALARRMNEQAALYQFTDRLQRAKSLEEICDAALESILRALQCQRASILLFDDSGVMKFVAWRGLSDGYRRVTEGHSPWTRDTREPGPICIGDIRDADVEPSLRAVIEQEGIAALAFIPLIENGTLAGKFMAYYDDPHEFCEDEVEIASTLGHQLGFGVDRIRTELARRTAVATLRESEARERANAARLQAIMDTVPAVIWIARDAECREIYGNRFASEILQLPPDRNQSLSAPDGERPDSFQVLVDGRVLEEDKLPVQRAARGEEIYNFEEEVRFADGSSRHLFGNAIPLLDADGQPAGAVAAFVDISDRKQAERQRDLMVAELNHRVKNTLAIVSAIAQQSFSRNPHADQERHSFSARIRALAQTHTQLAEAGWSGASLEAMLRNEFAPFIRDDRGNVRLSGPPVTLQAKCALTLGMSIHELATNAAKYGALSSDSGLLAICWRIDPAHRQLRIHWAEAGGPPVEPPARSGFGRFLVERALSFDLGGDVRLDFAQDGVQCEIAIPLEENILQGMADTH